MSNLKITTYILISLCIFSLSCKPIQISLKRHLTPHSSASFLNTSKNNTIIHKNITLSTQSSVSYHGNISIGSTNQTFSVLFDTGSLITWIAGKSKRNHYFNCTESTTCVKTKVNGTIRYGKGEISGKYVVDNIYINNLKSLDQFFIDATKI